MRGPSDGAVQGCACRSGVFPFGATISTGLLLGPPAAGRGVQLRPGRGAHPAGHRPGGAAGAEGPARRRARRRALALFGPSLVGMVLPSSPDCWPCAGFRAGWKVAAGICSASIACWPPRQSSPSIAEATDAFFWTLGEHVDFGRADLEPGEQHALARRPRRNFLSEQVREVKKLAIAFAHAGPDLDKKAELCTQALAIGPGAAPLMAAAIEKELRPQVRSYSTKFQRRGITGRRASG